MRKNTPLLTTLSIAMALGLGLSACGQGAGDPSRPGDTSAAKGSTVSVGALELENAWVKAAATGMTAAFGELRNNTDTDLTLAAVRYDGADMVQLHETIDDGSGSLSMQEKEGGFLVPARGSLKLEPGGNHIMIMSMTAPIEPGEEISLELVTADERSFPVTVMAKDYSGAQEEYAPGEADSRSTDPGEHKDADHGGH